MDIYFWKKSRSKSVYPLNGLNTIKIRLTNSGNCYNRSHSTIQKHRNFRRHTIKKHQFLTNGDNEIYYAFSVHKIRYQFLSVEEKRKILFKKNLYMLYGIIIIYPQHGRCFARYRRDNEHVLSALVKQNLL